MNELKYDVDITPETHDFFENKKVVVLDPQKSLRSTLRKISFDFGVGLSNIEFFEGTFSEAIEMLNEQRPEIILTPLNFENKSALEFFELHNRLFPDRMNSAFFVLSSNNSLSSACIALDYDIDGYVSEPFTKIGIGSLMLKALQTKIFQSPFEKEKSETKALIKQKKYEQAQEKAEDLFSMKDAQLEEVFYLQGLCALHQKNYNDALEFFSQSIQSRPDHYRSLRGKSDALIATGNWKEAYNVNKIIIGLYPLNPERIPELIKISIINKKYDDIFFFYDFFQRLEHRNPVIQKHVAAGLALCGKFLFENGSDKKALDALNASARFSNGALEITRTIVFTLLNNGKFARAREILYKTPEELESTPEFKLIELELLGRSADHVKEALTIGLNLIQGGHGSFKVFDTVIKLSIQLNRNPTFIEELISDASHKYPDEAEYFRKQIK